MDSTFDSLVLAVKQSLQGVFPRKPHTLDYTQVKVRFKKKLKITLNVKEIDQIMHFINLSIFDAEHQDPQLQVIDQSRIKTIIKNNIKLQGQIKDAINQNISKNQTLKVLGIIVEEMIRFKDPDKFQKEITQWRSKIVWDTKTYESKKLQLEHLLKKALSKEDFYLIAETWFHYMVFVEDLQSRDNYTKEQIKELKKTLVTSIAHYQETIKSNERLIKQLQDIDRFTYIDIEVQKKNLIGNQKQLDELKLLAERLRQDNSRELSANNILEKAYFSMFFLGQSLGLVEPEHNKDGNPLLTFLDILTGWTESKMPQDPTRKRLSTIYSKYKQFKSENNFVDNLLSYHHEKKGTLHSLLKEFQAHSLKLTIKPRPQPITQDA